VRVLDQPADWSWLTGGLKFISLQVHGLTDNGADKLYIALEDHDGRSCTLYHPDPNVLIAEAWQQWQIPLSDFTGVNLSKISKVFLGIGTRYQTSHPDYHLAGTIYSDDIRIYPPVCRADFAKTFGDINNDCAVDLADIRIMADNWLAQGQAVDPAVNLSLNDFPDQEIINLKDFAIIANHWLTTSLWP
jgi:hypothetical protein